MLLLLSRGLECLMPLKTHRGEELMHVESKQTFSHKMLRTKLSHLEKRSNISKRWSTSKNYNSKKQHLADITTRIQNTNVLKTNTTVWDLATRHWKNSAMNMNLSIMSSKTFNSYKAKVLNGHLVGSNQLLLDVRKNVREANGSKNDKDIVDIGVSYEMEAG
ncbi:uncharacterized protein TNCV_4147351 [Trichonephila clavipes]|nr:uncharacterized protein TNCV_4147351 [Trichonephila clavipes]